MSVLVCEHGRFYAIMLYAMFVCFFFFFFFFFYFRQMLSKRQLKFEYQSFCMPKLNFSLWSTYTSVFFFTIIYPIVRDYIIIHEKTFVFSFFFLFPFKKELPVSDYKNICLNMWIHLLSSSSSFLTIFLSRHKSSFWREGFIGGITTRSCSLLMHGKYSHIMVMIWRPDVHCLKGNEQKPPLPPSHFPRGK